MHHRPWRDSRDAGLPQRHPGTLERIGRDPDSCKVLFVVTPYVGDTREEAQSLFDRTHAATDWRAEEALAHLSAFTEIDFSRFDLDERIPDGLTTNGH
ncbi:hypothetical protein ACFC25_10320 [Pseudarthrobacter sp. NPDC055928]|uniref:hypothetical protein n=1 Tax=Pseudarthrobacter sp. NPDC055928 TaxID=3345661 RepID=UPI0035DD98DE